MKVLTWNLFHGRYASQPAARELLPEFSAALAGWDWDVALLQEVPPWWPAPLGRACQASARSALTSRNQLLPLRRLLAQRFPDLMKSEGGGCNAILVRGGAPPLDHKHVELTRTPERRVAHAVKLADGTWVMNLHASKQEPRARTEEDLRIAARALARWSTGAPAAVLGGDLNIPDPDAVLPDLTHISWHGVDHLYARGLARAGRGQVLDAGPLSDHRPVLAELERVDRHAFAGP